MLYKLFILVLTAFVAGIILTGCPHLNSTTKISQTKVRDAKENLMVPDQRLKDAIEQFKKESDEIILANEENIAEFKNRIADETLDNKALYQKKIAELAQKNNNIKTKLTNYQADGNDQWEISKTDFRHDMNELGIAFGDFTINNVK